MRAGLLVAALCLSACTDLPLTGGGGPTFAKASGPLTIPPPLKGASRP